MNKKMLSQGVENLYTPGQKRFFGKLALVVDNVCGTWYTK
jgi:hypothetical protein